MNFTPSISKRLNSRPVRTCRTIVALALITLYLTVGMVQAEPVRINQVVQTLTTYQGPSDLKVANLSQDPGSSGQKGSVPAGGPRNDTQVGPQVSGNGPAGLDALLSFPLIQDPQKLGVDVIEEAEVEGTICDCGDILVPGGAFPKWPLIFLAAVPLAFINHGDQDNPTSTPTPTPPTTPTPQTPNPVPEPASLFLFGTGLLAFGAGLRRRYAKSKRAEHANATKEEE